MVPFKPEPLQVKTNRETFLTIFSYNCCSVYILYYLGTVLGPASRKPLELLGLVKPFLVHLHLKETKNGEMSMPETSCMKGTSVYIKNI